MHEGLQYLLMAQISWRHAQLNFIELLRAEGMYVPIPYIRIHEVNYSNSSNNSCTSRSCTARHQACLSAYLSCWKAVSCPWSAGENAAALLCSPVKNVKANFFAVASASFGVGSRKAPISLISARLWGNWPNEDCKAYNFLKHNNHGQHSCVPIFHLCLKVASKHNIHCSHWFALLLLMIYSFKVGICCSLVTRSIRQKNKKREHFWAQIFYFCNNLSN